MVLAIRCLARQSALGTALYRMGMTSLLPGTIVHLVSANICGLLLATTRTLVHVLTQVHTGMKLCRPPLPCATNDGDSSSYSRCALPVHRRHRALGRGSAANVELGHTADICALLQ